MRYNYKDIYSIMGNLHDLYNDGFPIYYSFDLIEETSISKKYKNSISIIKDCVKKGSSVANAFNKAKIYPDFLVNLIKVGEENGSLGEVLNNLNYYYYKKYKLKKYISSSLIYPIFIITTLILGSFAFLFIVFPKMFESFKNINKNMSSKLLCLYNFISLIKYSPLSKILIISTIIILSIFLFIFLLIKSGIIAKFFKKSKLGKLLTEYKFISFLSMIVVSGSSIVEIMKMNIDYKSLGVNEKIIKEFVEGIKSGSEINIIMKNFDFISKYTLSIIKIGESRGQIEDSLLKASKTLERKVNDKISKAVKLVQPALIVFITIMISFIIIEFLGPVLDIMNIKGENF
ncbi:type II secretion system F family protein [Clostridium sp. HCP1S3_B4]|uniref:type II secretion system F family protein n=1 Tax=unclassified Clostridium TaxID=2614128 RepID=UPI003F89A044